MITTHLSCVLFLLLSLIAASGQDKDLSLQLAPNPPMRFIARPAPEPAPITDAFETRPGFTLIETLEAFRAAIKKDGQKIRMKPGVYRADSVDPPMTISVKHAQPDEKGQKPTRRQQHIFAVNGSGNHFDLRGVVIETPVSIQSKLGGGAHVADSWHINGADNTFEGGYFRNVVDRPYPQFRATECEFEICNDGNTFLNCTFVIKGSSPYGYSDYYGKGGPNFGGLNKHSFMSIDHAKNTKIIGCKLYMQSFGHAIHLHNADGVLIKDCFLTGALRPTSDIHLETTGRAKDYNFNIMYRGQRPIPRDQMIPLTEDGIRTYGGDKNITVVNTTIERMRGCLQIHSQTDITLDNVTVLEAGDFAFDLSAGGDGKVVMKNCRADLAYNPIFNLTRGALPKNSQYELTILSPAEGIAPTPRTSLGVICGDRCTFTIHDGALRPLPEKANQLTCGGAKPLTNSTVINETTAKLILKENVENCTIRSVGPVVDLGKNNTIVVLKGKASANPPKDNEGFTAIFDGRSLAGWRSLPAGSDDDWVVRDGVIIGTGSQKRLCYLVWKEENLTDFELKLKYRLPAGGNTGIEIRAQPDATGKRPLIGYHADIGHAAIGDQILGAWDFHFAGREEYSCKRGVRLLIDENGKATRSAIENPFLPSDLHERQWNDIHVVAKGRNFKFYINGKLASEFTDNAAQGRLDSGGIGLQIHDKGMSVEFKDIQLKK